MSAAVTNQLELGFDPPAETLSDREPSGKGATAASKKPRRRGTNVARRATNVEELLPFGAQSAKAALVGGQAVPLTLAAVLNILEQSHRTNRKHREMASAVRQVAKVLDCELDEIPSSPDELARLLEQANPALVGMKRQRWGTIKSLLRAALAEVGFDVMPGRDAAGLSADWQALASPLSRRYRYGLSRVFSYCSRRGIAPSDVDDTTFAEFREALISNSLQANPEGLYRNAVNIWNEAVQRLPGWPASPITPPSDGRRSALPPQSFPLPLQDSIEACLTDALKPDPFAKNYRKPLHAATIHARRKQLYQAARALVETGMPASEITSVSVLVDVKNATELLRYLHDQKGGITPSLGVMAETLRSTARRLGKTSEADMDWLTEMVGRFTPKRNGLTPRNRSRLRQFDIEANVDAILSLPAQTIGKVQRHDRGGNIDAVGVMLALSVQILTCAPMRLRNLTGLRLDRHIKTVRRRGQRSVSICIPAEETKTNKEFEVVLSAETARLLTLYVDSYRGRIAGGAGPYLFPGRGGARRADTRFGASISKFIWRETGLQMNPHLFRHFAAMIYLRLHPDGIEVVRQLLGHTSTRTTLKAYADPKSDFAFQAWDETLAEHRDGRHRLKQARNKRAGKAGAK
jgi:integrase